MAPSSPASPPSKELARRLRFDRRPPRDRYRRWFLPVMAAGLVLGAASWGALHATRGERTYLPRPVSSNHAPFGDRCETCHVEGTGGVLGVSRPVPDEACRHCHVSEAHTPYEVRTPPCAECHVEHRDTEVFRRVSETLCIDCHGALESRRDDGGVSLAIDGFAVHPPFRPLRADAAGGAPRDRSRIRFDHALHATSTRVDRLDPIREGPEPRSLQCRACHRPALDGALMEPVRFEQHCERCHSISVNGPIAGIEVPHGSTDGLREAIVAGLVVQGVAQGERIFGGDASFVLPGRGRRGPIDESASLRAYRDEWRGKLEARLLAPFDDTEPLFDANPACALCHDLVPPAAAGELALVVDPAIPERWLEAGRFHHRRHDHLDCSVCHEGAETSERTADVLLPDHALCASCHVDDAAESAGTACRLCHAYHPTSRDPARRDRLVLDRAVPPAELTP